MFGYWLAVVHYSCGQLLQAAEGCNKIFGPLVLIDVVTVAAGWPLGEAISLIYRPFGKELLLSGPMPL